MTAQLHAKIKSFTISDANMCGNVLSDQKEVKTNERKRKKYMNKCDVPYQWNDSELYNLHTQQYYCIYSTHMEYTNKHY